MTFSAPKSVSLLWAFATSPVAEVVAGAHREAVAESLVFLEQRAAVARVQARGVRRRVATEGWAVAGFGHRTSREGDPQLHTHCLVPNLVRRKGDGRHVALDAGPLFDWCRAAGSIYQAHLQRSLTLRLGVAWGPDRHNTREMLGLSVAQLRAFSKRSLQIEAELEAKGARYEAPALRMQADDEASLATRTTKDHSLTPALLEGRWHEEAAAVGVATGTELEEALCWKEPATEAPGWDEMAHTLVDPEVGLCSRSARFTAADVVEHICALSGGRLTTEDVVTMAERFLASDMAVRLTPDIEEGRRRPAEWSTAAHRALEDRTLALIDALAGRQVPAVNGAVLEATLAAAPALGEDQVAAVRVLAGEGGGLRAVLAPAGYGKTTMLNTAAQAAVRDGRRVLAVATTARAVAELAGAGLDGRTIARLRLDLSSGPLPAGTVVVLDEISQTPTHEVEAVLAAVDACPGGSVWALGDPRQSQPVGAGGAADHIERLADQGLVPSARLSVNRRQVDPDDQEALGLLRQGEAAASQQLRSEHGWEHELPTPGESRTAMAAAVCADIERHGAAQVAALVVSHTDAEDVAERVRARLAAVGTLSGPALVGPGWTAEREYQAGDRVLLHARCGPSDTPLVNGTTATVTAVEQAGLTVLVDGGREQMNLPTAFVQGARKDGSPNLSHAWARTVDGAQGGTWEACHLLGSAALDAYRGYTGQSRSRQPTHTWNTARVVVVDHGGALADQRGAAEQVADALARQPDPSLAARSDPWVVDRQIREQIAEHEGVLAGRPPHRREALVTATEDLRSTESGLADLEAILSRTADRLAALGALAGLTRRGREQRRTLEAQLAADAERATAAQANRDDLARRTSRLLGEQETSDRFEAAEGWRRDDVAHLRDQLDHHWSEVMAACVQADDALAFGVDRLRHARATTAGDLRNLEAGIPVDRATERDDARRQLAGALRARQQAEEALRHAGAALDESRRRPWGRKDQQQIATAQAGAVLAEQALEQAAAGEAKLQERFSSLSQHERERQQATAAAAARRAQLAGGLAQFDTALDHTRADRVRAFADDPPAYLVERLGPVPRSPAGRAVWCHHALGIEAALDRSDALGAPPRRHDTVIGRARQEVAVADRMLHSSVEVNDEADPSCWAELAGEGRGPPQ